ncbi:MAG TPA: PAS domain S-box protein, partial [Rubricoccaceae bacterium]|nr:PAS domain S-box protein [Rubricoccaceae bacterium]
MDEPLRSDPPAPTTAGGDAAPVGANGEEAGGDGPNGTGPDGAGRRGRAEQRFRVVFDAMAEFVGLMEPDGTLIEANRTALDFGGLRPEDVVGKKLWEGAWWAGSEEARERLQAAVGRAAHGEFVRYEADVLGAGGRPATLDLSVKPVRGDDGRVDLLIAEGRPITEAVQARRMQEGLVAAQAGTFEIDLATQAVHRSVSTDLIFGFDPDDAPRVLDDYLGRIHPEDLPAALDAIRRAVEEGGEHFVECRLLLPDGRERWMAARGMALPGVRGGSARLVGAIMDVTEQRAAERERRRDDEQRHAALEAAQLGTWDYDLAEAVVHVDERCRAVFGLDRGTVTLDEALARVHPEDRPAVERALGAAADPAGGGRFDVEYRFVRPPGEERWVRATGSTLFEGEGKARRAVRLAGVVMDETERLAAEQRLHESAQRLRLALDAAEMGTWVWDLASGRRVTDARECALLGEPPGAFPTTDAFFARVHPDDLPGLLRKIDEALAGGGDYEHEFRVTHADGTVRWLAARGREARDERGSVRLLGVHFDVTARKAAERALRESERRYRTFLAISQEGIWQFDLDAPIPTDLPVDEQIARMYRDAWLAECNAAFARMYGFERPEEIVGARLPDLLPPDDPANTAYLRAFIENGYRLNVGESHEVDREGRPRVFENTLTGEVEGGCVVRAWGTQRDVTERKAAERDQALLAAIVASSDDAVVSMTLDGVITSWNAGAERVFGYTAEEAVGQPVLMLIPPERRGEEDRLLGRIRQGERVDHYETVRLAKDGRRIDVSAAVSPVRDGAGVLIGASKVARDVTAQKAAERALREGEARLRAAVGAAPLVLTQVDRDLRHTWYYSAYPDVGGGAEILGRRLDELTTPAEAAALQDLQRRVIETGEGARGEVAFRLDDGDHFFDVTVEPLRDGDGRVVGATTASFDVTDRVRAEEALRASEERFRLAAGAVAGMVYDWDVASDEVFRTEGLYDLVGVRPEDVPAERTWWVDLVHPDDRERVFDLIRTVLDSDAKHYAAEYRVRHEDGRWVHLWDRGYIVRDEAGRAVRVVGSAADVSDRKRAEEALRASEERFRLTVSNDALTLFEQDADLRYTWVYPQHPEFPEANIGRTDAELVPGEGGARLMRLKQAVLETGAGVREEVEVPLPTGTRWYDLVIEPHLDDDGRVAGIAGVALDVTDRKRAEAALRESEARFRQLAEALPQIVYTLPAAGGDDTEYLNPRWYEYTGMPPGTS